MGKRFYKADLVKRVVDKLKDTKIVIGGNKYFYKKLYHLKCSLASSHSEILSADSLILCIRSGNVTDPRKICHALKGLITDPTLT